MPHVLSNLMATFSAPKSAPHSDTQSQILGVLLDSPHLLPLHFQASAPQFITEFLFYLHNSSRLPFHSLPAPTAHCGPPPCLPDAPDAFFLTGPPL